MKVVYWPFTRPDGSTGIQSRVELWDGVTVVALDQESHHVYVVRQKRETPGGPVATVELPGGGIDPGKTPLEAAKSELLEEAGVGEYLEEPDWIQLYGDKGIHPIDGLAWTCQHAFLLLNARRLIRAPKGEDEIDVVECLPLSELINMDKRNEFADPLSPYALRRAQDWLTERKPNLLT